MSGRVLRWVLLLLAVLPLSGDAVTYHVTTTGSDGNNGTSQGTAWATIQHAHDTAACGDTITVHAGTYFQRPVLTKSCTLGSPLVIQGVRTGQAWDTIIDGSTATSGWTSAAASCGSALCFRISNPGFTPRALIATSDKLSVWRIHQSNGLGGPACSGCSGTGFQAMSRAATSTINWGQGTVNYWDGVEALWGEAGGFTYARFRNGEDPDTLSVRVAPAGGTITINGGDAIFLRDLQIEGGQWQVEVNIGSTDILIEHSLIRGGEAGIEVDDADDTIIQDNTLHPWYIGSVAGYTSTPFLPGDWNSSSNARRVMGNIYRVNKFDVGSTREGHPAVVVQGGSDGTIIRRNTIPLSVVGIELEGTINTEIAENTITQCSAECIWFVGIVNIVSIHDNLFVDGEHLLRIQEARQNGRMLHYYRNRHYQPQGSAKHTYFSFDTGQAITNSVYWFYHNTFAGSGWAIDAGEGPTGWGPCVRIVNNLISVTGVGGDRGLSSTSWGGKLGVYAYNWIGEVSSGAPASPTNGQGCSGGFVGNNTNGTAAIWPLTPQPDFIPPDGHAALNTGLRLDQAFTINGVQYSALPGITTQYYGDDLPDRGAVQEGGTACP